MATLPPTIPDNPKPATPPVQDNLIKDNETLEVKGKLLGNMRGSALLNSVSKVTMFLGGILAAGSGAACVGAAVSALSAGSGFAGFMTALGTTAVGATATAAAATAAATSILGVLAVGAALIGVAVIADYAASRIWQAGNFDNFELNARSTAKHLVKEIKANNMCFAEDKGHDACRADGKSWAQVVQSQQAAGQTLQK